MAEQNGNALYRYTREQQFDGKCMPETMRVPSWDFCEREEFRKATLPVSDCALELPLTRPKKYFSLVPRTESRD
jgi:hypothetical protein